MKTDDIFEAITDIDDKFLEEAHPTDFDSTQPIVVRPAPKRPLWKTLVPIAACLAVVCTAGAFGVRYLRGHVLTETSNPAASDIFPSSNEDFKYPDEAKFVVSEKYYEDPSLFNPCFLMDTKWDYEDTYAKSYEELAALSDLIVAGEFADYTHQTQDPSKVHVSSPDTNDHCFNYLRVESVIMGDIKAGQYVLIQQNDPISGNGDRAVQLNSDDRLTPMFKGDRWIYFLKKNGDCYEPVNGPQGRYPMPGSNNVDVSNSGKIGMVDKYCALTNAAPARDEIYDTVVALLQAEKPKLKEIRIPLSGAPNDFVMEEFPDYSFTATYEGILLNGCKINAVDVAIISGDYVENLFLCDLNGDGRRELCATVVTDGVRSVDVVDFANDKCYTMQGYGRCSYSLEAENNYLMSILREDNGDCLLETHDPLSLDKMTPILSNTALTMIADEKRFKLAEFPDKTFEIIDGRIVMDDIKAPEGTMRNSLIDGIEYYLTDLNGDGKREICCWGSIGSGIDYRYIVVYDIANDERYVKAGMALENLISLDVNDGVLYAVTNEYYPDSDKKISRKPLTLDILEKVSKSDTAYEEIPLFIDQTFTKEDFPGVEFTVDTSTEVPTFRFGWEGSSVANNVHSGVYLCDIDGDGKREICLSCPFAGNGIIRVYGYMDNGDMGCAVYYEDGGCWLGGGDDGTLKYYTNDKTEPFKFSKSDLKPTFAQSYFYELVGWDHSIDFTEIVPALGSYDVEIKECVLKIKHGGEQIFDSGIWLYELYLIPDQENNSVILVYKTVNEGAECMFGAIKLSENSAERYDFEKGVTLKPVKDKLLIVNPDGSEEPFKFPENSYTLPLGE